MLGEVVDWAMRIARKPQRIYAVAAALGLGSVLMGRKYKTTNENWSPLYILAIGKSGTGKENIKTVPERILEAAHMLHLVGPNKYTSDAGVMSALIDRPTHIHITDEFGLQLEAANKDRGNFAKDVTPTTIQQRLCCRHTRCWRSLFIFYNLAQERNSLLGILARQRSDHRAALSPLVWQLATRQQPSIVVALNQSIGTPMLNCFGRHARIVRR